LIANDRKSNSTYTRFLTGFKAYTKILAVINTSILKTVLANVCSFFHLSCNNFCPILCKNVTNSTFNPI
jgi:hypothetical protein